MAAIDFGNFPASFTGVNMSDQAALTQAILSDFTIFNFSGGYRDISLVEIINTANASSATAVVRAHGSFTFPFNSTTPVDASNVFAIEVIGPQGFYRLVVEGLNVSWLQLKNALTSGNLFPLWAGEPLDILGQAVLADTLVGGSLDDEIWGYGGHDVLTGDAGNDYLDGMGGRDTMRGGLGNDDYVVGHARDLVQESDGQGIDQVITSVDYRLPAFVEDLAMLNGGGAIDGKGNSLANYMEGNPSANRLAGLGGNDTLVGLDGADTLEGGAGHDRLFGDQGTDVLRGGDGNDLLFWDSADAAVYGGSGTDTLKLGLGHLNLLRVDNGLIVDFERISLAGNGANTLKLSKSDLLDMASGTTLRVLGEAGDTVNATRDFVEMNTVSGYTRYRSGSATLWIDSDIAVI
jgi:Ca2+-binding RTX toxin-like protein